MSNMKKILILLLVLCSFYSTSQEFSSDKATIVKEQFINKGGKATNQVVYYHKDGKEQYFIKFCESNLTRKSVDKFIDEKFHVAYKLTEGLWDICEDDPAYAQSRTGKYVVIRKIIFK